MKDFACGELHSLAVCNSGEVYAWGAGEFGQLGNNSRYDRSSPERVKFSEDLKIHKLDAGKNHSVILTDQGFLYCFGEDNLGQLGLRRKKKIVEVPTLVSYMTHKAVTNVACGTFHTVILIDPYYVFTTGNNKYGQLGVGECPDKAIFTFVKKLSHKNVIDIFAGDHHSWFILDHDDPFVDDYEIPEPWRFSERSISDDPDYVEGRIKKNKKKRDDTAMRNEFADTREMRMPEKPQKKKKKRRKRELDLDFEDDPVPKVPRNKMNYFDKQEKEGEDPYENGDLEDEEEWEESEESNGLIGEEMEDLPPNEKLIRDEENSDMKQKNFYPNKKNYKRNSKENSRMDDSLGLTKSKVTNSKKSLNMMGGMDPKKNDFSMKPNMLGGGPNLSNMDIPSSSRMMRGTESQENTSFNQNNSMRMDSRKKIQMKPNSGLNMMGSRGDAYKDMGIISSGNHQNIPEEKNLEREDSELMSEREFSESQEGSNNLEYESRRIYPNPKAPKDKLKRRTVDNPMTMENDLVNTFNMMNKGKGNEGPGKRHQSQADKKPRNHHFSENEMGDLGDSLGESGSGLSLTEEDPPYQESEGGLNTAGPFTYPKANQKKKRRKKPKNQNDFNMRPDVEDEIDEESEEDWEEDPNPNQKRIKKGRKNKRRKNPRGNNYEDEEESEGDSGPEDDYNNNRRGKRKNRKNRNRNDEESDYEDSEEDPRKRRKRKKRNRGEEDDSEEEGSRRRNRGNEGPGRDNAGFWNQNQFHAGNVPERRIPEALPNQERNGVSEDPNQEEGRNNSYDQRVVHNTYNTYNTYNVEGNRRFEGSGGVPRQNEGGIPVEVPNRIGNDLQDQSDDDDLMNSKSRKNKRKNDTAQGGRGDSEDSQRGDFSSEKEMNQRKKREEERRDKKSFTDLGKKYENSRERPKKKSESIGNNVMMREKIGRVNLEDEEGSESEEKDYDLDESYEEENPGTKKWEGNPPGREMGGHNSMSPPGHPIPKAQAHGGNNPNEYEYPGKEGESPNDFGGRQYSTGLNIIKEEEDFPSSAQTNPRQSRQKMFENDPNRNIQRKRQKKKDPRNQRGNGRTVKVRREEHIEEIGEPESELVFEVMDERIERERVEVRKRRVLTCATRVVLTDNKRSHRFVVMRIKKQENQVIKDRIAQYIDILGEADPGMEYYNVTDFDNVFRQADQFQLERVEDLGDFTSLTLMMIHNMAEYGGLVGGDIREVTEEYRQIRSQLTTIGEMYIFTDEESSGSRKWQRLSQWVHIFKDMFKDQIHGMSVLELRPKEFK